MLKKILALVALLYTALAMAAVDVNKATEAELDSVKGIGPGTSKMILQERKKAPFKDWDDFITRVKGVGEARATNLSEAGLTVGGKPYQPTAAGAKKDDKAAATGKKDDKAASTARKDDKASARDEKKAAKADAKAEKKDAKDERKTAAARPAASAASAAKK